MKPSTLHKHSEAYEERNNFLYFMLGLVSLARSLLTLFAEQPEQGSESGEQASTDELYDLLR